MTTNPSLTFDHDYDIRSYEPRGDGRVSITAICDHMQDIASRHADTLGFGFDDLKRTGHFWMLARAYVMMDRLPGFGETCRLTTWPSGNERLIATRDYLVREDDKLIGRATSNWVAVDLETHRAQRPEDVLDSRHIPDVDRALNFVSKAVPRLKEGDFTTTITARRSDQDINGHVNSVRYAEFCLEAVPTDWLENHQCMGLDIQFRNESWAGDTYLSSCSVSEPDNGKETMQHSLNRISDNTEIVRMRSWWITL